MKAFTIAWKDTLVRFRDRNALILMFAAPLLITAIIGSAFGGFISNDGDVPISDIPFVIVNEDEGKCGQAIVRIFTETDQLASLVDTQEMDDVAAAQEEISQGNLRAVLHIPNDFSANLQGGATEEQITALLNVYVDPAASITPNIIRGIVTEIAAQFSTGIITSQVIQESLSADLPPGSLGNSNTAPENDFCQSIGGAANASNDSSGNNSLIAIERIVAEEEDDFSFDPFAFFGPSMGLFFLMFTALSGSTSILSEQRNGTLDRLMTTPTGASTILLGKIGGILTTGIMQYVIYVLATTIIFGLNWGNPIGIAIMVLAFTAAATSLGMIVASISRDATQANIIGSPIIIISGLLGGTFLPAQSFPDWLQTLSRLSINRWGLDGFTDLTLFRLGVSDILLEAGVLFVIAIVFFTIATTLFQKRMAR